MARVYLPDGSKKIVVPDARLNEYLSQGYLTQEGYRELTEAETARYLGEWLANPQTIPERFATLREERDYRLARTDYLMQSDYPLEPDTRKVVIAYRQALRDLPALPGAPWDGGGTRTPWPANPLA